MNGRYLPIGILVALIIVLIGFFATPIMFAGRATPGMSVGKLHVSGMAITELPGTLSAYENDILSQKVSVTLRGVEKIYVLRDLGFNLDEQLTTEKVKKASEQAMWPRLSNIRPVLTVDPKIANLKLYQDFGGKMTLGKNASLTITAADQLVLQPSSSGEQVDLKELVKEVTDNIYGKGIQAIELTISTAPAPIQDQEVEGAKTLARHLLKDGMKLTFEDKEFDLKPFTIKRMLKFQEQIDPWHGENTILGIAFDDVQMRSYLEKTITPEVNQTAVNARFDLKKNEEDDKVEKVEQFAIGKRGQALDIDKTIMAIQSSLAAYEPRSNLIVNVTEPDISENTNIEAMGITKLLAVGETDFKGSPRNRVHNIEVGTAKYQGLLIPPAKEFSFLEYLGPVDGDHGFKPELVIKNNVTTPEFGGGLCQVSTTAFRAAVFSGLEVVQRRNHSYAVAYYGTPGFDATIYPPYTDLRFLNNTPGYILIQTRIEGTKLIFEFWGTDDGRSVEVDGPHPYNRQPDGSVKATLTQMVKAADGATLVDDTFYSNYKSPKLFPKVLSANGESITPGQTTIINDNPITSPQATTAPAPSAEP